MKKTVKKFFSNQYVVGTLVIVFGYFLTSGITAATKKIKIWDAVKAVATAIGKGISAFLKFSIPVWVILIAIIVFICAAKFIKWFLKATDNLDLYLHYTKDRIKNWTFIWNYSKYDNQLENLTPICENCECPLSERGESSYIVSRKSLCCPMCEREYEPLLSQDKKDTIKIIWTKISTGKYTESPFYFGKPKRR